MGRFAGFIAALAALPLAAVYVGADDPVVREGAWMLLVAGSCGAVLAGIRVHRPAALKPWLVVALGFVLLLLNNAVLFPGFHPGPAVRVAALLLELTAFVLIGVAALLMVRAQSPEGDRDSAIDGAIVMVALATVLYGTVFSGDGPWDGLSLARVLAFIAPLVLAGVVTAMLRLLFRGVPSTPSTWLLALSATSALIGHVLRTISGAAGTYVRGDVEDLFIAIAYVTVGLAALHPSMRRLVETTPIHEAGLTRLRVVILAASLISAPVTLLLRTGTDAMPVVASAVVAALVLWRLWRGIRDREVVNDRLQHEATHDDLTGLPNRAALLEYLRRSTGDTAGVTLLFIDVDGFKGVNDDFGHAAGDELLVALVERLRALCSDEDVLARLSGDELVIVGLRPSQEAAGALARAVVDVARPGFNLHAGTVEVALSVGVAWCATGRTPTTELLAQADAAMYEAKRSGGDRFRIYDAELGQLLARSRRIERDLPGAAQRGELALVYQPVLRCSAEADASGDIVGVEALLRWSHAELGAISPAEAIPIADASGAIVPLGDWVLRAACDQLRTWQRELGTEDLAMYVNVSPRQLLAPGFVDRAAAILAESGTDPGDVVLEVTETAVLDVEGEGLRTLHALHALGLRLALDDFGTGYSSLIHLKQMPFDLLKIDASFVQGVVVDSSDRIIVEAMIGIAHHRGAHVVGEGVETASQGAGLHALGCDLQQGYHLGRPTDAESMTELLRAATTRDATVPERRALRM